MVRSCGNFFHAIDYCANSSLLGVSNCSPSRNLGLSSFTVLCKTAFKQEQVQNAMEQSLISQHQPSIFLSRTGSCSCPDALQMCVEPVCSLSSRAFAEKLGCGPPTILCCAVCGACLPLCLASLLLLLLLWDFRGIPLRRCCSLQPRLSLSFAPCSCW